MRFSERVKSTVVQNHAGHNIDRTGLLETLLDISLGDDGRLYIFLSEPRKVCNTIQKDRNQHHAADDCRDIVKYAKSLLLRENDALRILSLPDNFGYLFVSFLYLITVHIMFMGSACDVLHKIDIPIDPSAKCLFHKSSSVSPGSALSSLLIFFNVTRKRMPETPAPTAASVIARSGDSIRIQRMHITEL